MMFLTRCLFIVLLTTVLPLAAEDLATRAMPADEPSRQRYDGQPLRESVIFLEYISPCRIQEKMKSAAQKIARVHRVYRCSMVAGIAAMSTAVGAVAYAFLKPSRPEDELAELRQGDAALAVDLEKEYKKERIKLYRERQTFKGMLKQEVKRGATAAFYTATAMGVAGALSKVAGVTWSSEWFTRRLFPTTSDLFAQEVDQIGRAVQHFGGAMQQYLSEARLVRTEDDYASFKIINRFFISDVEFAVRMLVHGLEDFIALVCEIARDRSLNDDRTLALFIENIDITVAQVNEMIRFVDELVNARSAEAIEEVIDRVSFTSTHGLKCSVGLANMAKGLLRES